MRIDPLFVAFFVVWVAVLTIGMGIAESWVVYVVGTLGGLSVTFYLMVYQVKSLFEVVLAVELVLIFASVIAALLLEFMCINEFLSTPCRNNHFPLFPVLLFLVIANIGLFGALGLVWSDSRRNQ